MTLELIPDEDPRLHTKAKVVNIRTFPDFTRTVNQMFVLMREHDGMGLAAPQVGISKRFFIMSYRGQDYVCVNPRVLKRSAETEVLDEGCLSYPGQKVMVERTKEIQVAYQTERGRSVRKKMSGMLARCFLHELDHLNGIVMADVGTIVRR